MNRRRALSTLAIGVGASVLAACSGNSTPKSAPEAAPAAPTLTYQPGADASDVIPTAAVGVQVAGGWFQTVKLTNPDGKVVAGTLNQDREAMCARLRKALEGKIKFKSEQYRAR